MFQTSVISCHRIPSRIITMTARDLHLYGECGRSARAAPLLPGEAGVADLQGMPAADLAPSDPLYKAGGTDANILACFGLQVGCRRSLHPRRLYHYDRWKYVAATTSSVHIETLDEVAAGSTGLTAANIGFREPNFFELLKAAILSGSLGTKVPWPSPTGSQERKESMPSDWILLTSKRTGISCKSAPISSTNLIPTAFPPPFISQLFGVRSPPATSLTNESRHSPTIRSMGTKICRD